MAASDEQRVLEAASVVGTEFSAAAVAAALECPVGDVEVCCTRLARRELFVSATGTATRPDGTIASSFRFDHGLYLDVLYDRVPAGHRGQLHQRIAVPAHAAWRTCEAEIAVELAFYYRRGATSGRP